MLLDKGLQLRFDSGFEILATLYAAMIVGLMRSSAKE